MSTIEFKKWEVVRHPLWMTDEEFDELKVFVNSTDFSQYEHAHTLEFAKHKLIVLVYTSNKLEETIPKDCSEHETYALLKRLLDNVDSAFARRKRTGKQTVTISIQLVVRSDATALAGRTVSDVSYTSFGC